MGPEFCLRSFSKKHVGIGEKKIQSIAKNTWKPNTTALSICCFSLLFCVWFFFFAGQSIVNFSKWVGFLKNLEHTMIVRSTPVDNLLSAHGAMRSNASIYITINVIRSYFSQWTHKISEWMQQNGIFYGPRAMHEQCMALCFPSWVFFSSLFDIGLNIFHIKWISTDFRCFFFFF